MTKELFYFLSENSDNWHSCTVETKKTLSLNTVLGNLLKDKDIVFDPEMVTITDKVTGEKLGVVCCTKVGMAGCSETLEKLFKLKELCMNVAREE